MGETSGSRRAEGRARSLRNVLLATIGGAALAGNAAAQSTGPVAPTREEITRQQQQPAPPPSRLEVEGGIERAPCALDNPEFRDVRFVLRDVQFDGLKGLSPQDLRPAYEGLVGQEQPVSILCEIRDRTATILRDAGYIAAVEVPEQRIAEGNVRFRVLMAKLVQVRVRGNAGRAERTIAGYLSRLQDQEVFNRIDAERYLLLASDIPGYNVRLALRPAGTVPGEVIGEVTVLRMPALVDFNVQNYGSRELGPWGGLLRAQLYGLTGLGDRTTLAVYSTADFHEQQTLQVGHDFRVGPEGITVSGLFTYAWAQPDIEGEDAEVDARTLYATAEVGYPLVRSQARSLRGAIGFDLVNQDVELGNADLSRDRLRVAFLRLTGDAVSLDYRRASVAEPLWRLLGSLELRHGLDIFGATDGCSGGLACFDADEVPPSRPEADATATVLRGSLYGEYRPAPKLTFALGALGQYSNDPLMSFEEFSAGNFTAGRGYDPGVIQGDRGIGFQAEIRAGSQVPATTQAVAAEPYLFFDFARVGNEDRFTDLVGGARDLSSFGGGVRATWGDKMRFDLAFAVPLEKAGFPAEQPDVRILLSITTRLVPWSFR